MRFLVLLLPLLAAADWPQYLGPTRDGHSPEVGLNWDWPKEGPTTVWKKDVGSGWAGPAVADNRLILFHRSADNETIDCLDPATGQPKWSHSYATRYRDDFGFDDGPRATPLIAGGKVFTLGANGDLTVLELANGKPIWSKNLIADYAAPKGYFGIACSPLLAGGLLLVNVGAKGAGIVAFDPANGKEIWKATDDAASYSSPVEAEIDGKKLVLFLTRQGLVGLEPEMGKTRYTFPWRPRLEASVNAATPLVFKDEIFLTVSYSTGAVLLRAKGMELEEVWSNDKSLSCHYNTPVRIGEFLYGVHGRQEGGRAELRCVAWKSGEVKWKQHRFGVATLLAVDGGVLALNEAGDLVRFEASAEGYKERARANILTHPTRAAPALAGGRLFARDGKTLVCVTLKK